MSSQSTQPNLSTLATTTATLIPSLGSSIRGKRKREPTQKQECYAPRAAFESGAIDQHERPNCTTPKDTVITHFDLRDCQTFDEGRVGKYRSSSDTCHTGFNVESSVSECSQWLACRTSPSQPPLLPHTFSTEVSTPRNTWKPINQPKPSKRCNPSRQFTLFPKLPLELQLVIWGLAAQQRQVIGVKDLEDRRDLCGTTARCPLMIVCKASRCEALRAKVDLNASSSTFSTSAAEESKLTTHPRIYTTAAADIVWLQIHRADIYAEYPVPLYHKIISTQLCSSIRSLAVDYKLFRRRWDHLNAMVLKLDLNELILLIAAENINPDNVAVLIKTRQSGKGCCSPWRTWNEMVKSERRRLADYLAHARRSWERGLNRGETAEQLVNKGKRDLSNWHMPRILLRDIVNSNNATAEEMVAVKQEDDDFTEDIQCENICVEESEEDDYDCR